MRYKTHTFSEHTYGYRIPMLTTLYGLCGAINFNHLRNGPHISRGWRVCHGIGALHCPLGVGSPRDIALGFLLVGHWTKCTMDNAGSEQQAGVLIKLIWMDTTSFWRLSLSIYTHLLHKHRMLFVCIATHMYIIMNILYQSQSLTLRCTQGSPHASCMDAITSLLPLHHLLIL